MASTIKVTNIDTPDGTGNITVDRPLSGSGASLTSLNASNLASGTVADARFPATLPAASGANLTALNATQLTSGTVADARISTLTASKLTGALPAISGASLTGITANDNTPRFFVTTGDHNTTLTPGTWSKVTIMSTTIVDTDSAWSTANDKFTIPSGEGGDYMFGANATFASASNQLQGFRLGIYKNGSRVYSGYMTYYYDYTSKFRHGHAGVICMDSASASDYYEFYLLAYGHTDIKYMDDSENFRYTNFWGFKLA